jgi:hypothetical protein
MMVGIILVFLCSVGASIYVYKNKPRRVQSPKFAVKIPDMVDNNNIIIIGSNRSMPQPATSWRGAK